jgi:hypothetical protein
MYLKTMNNLIHSINMHIVACNKINGKGKVFPSTGLGGP